MESTPAANEPATTDPDGSRTGVFSESAGAGVSVRVDFAGLAAVDGGVAVDVAVLRPQGGRL